MHRKEQGRASSSEALGPQRRGRLTIGILMITIGFLIFTIGILMITIGFLMIQRPGSLNIH